MKFRNSFSALTICALALAGTPLAYAQSKVTIYTTAKNTDLRITQTTQGELKPFGQPFETQPCVFVDSTHTFQTMVGIGGAITDATAETYAKLSPEGKRQFVKAYFRGRHWLHVAQNKYQQL